MLEGLHLSDEFGHITAHFGSEHFHGSDVEVGIDDEATADIHTGCFIIGHCYTSKVV